MLVDINVRGSPDNAQLDGARDAGVAQVVLTSPTIEQALLAQRVAARRQGGVAFAAGLHPHAADRWCDATKGVLHQLLSDRRCVAVGPTGLDYARMRAPMAVQRRVFGEHIQLAVRHGLPLMVHERDRERGGVLDSHRHVCAALDVHNARSVVIHCHASPREADLVDYVARGYYIGVTDTLAHPERGRRMRQLLPAVVPLERLVVATEPPRTRPEHLVRLTDTLADLYRADAHALRRQLVRNVHRLCPRLAALPSCMG